ncbi:uncharacterized protein LOC112574841 [Pomacea canaliculata]|uniref:uncharacterized protein LOC112574841 n=1 Tax=Pomacea canaliculata TaxID=400727 RepID=UPI000D73A2C8|nr:uncharacterized protein LOC112574841 [Pomacea canaliculata]XP_025111946.1 uncharacterized protein LOC112574841 [Pomacea canaliculata]
MTGARRDGGGRVRVYLHAVTDKQVSFFTDNRNNPPFQEVKNVTGADVEFDQNPSPVPGMKIVLIRGLPSQIEAAVRFISEKTGVRETISEQAQKFWLQLVEAAFPDLDSRAYFLPPVYVNRVPMSRQSVGGQDVLVLQPAPVQAGQSNQLATASSDIPQGLILQPPAVYDSDIRDDAAMQRVLICLQRMFEQKKEAVVGINQLRFGQYLGEPCYFAATAQLPLSKSLPKASLRDRQGD